MMKASSFAATPAQEAAALNGEAAEEDEETKKNAASPTPYATYQAVELLASKAHTLDVQAVRLLEGEMAKVTRRLAARPCAFDLARRGALARKLGLVGAALADLEAAIGMEANYVDAYWQRHLIFLTQGRLMIVFDI